jgi:hypothetical protein
MFGDPQVFTVNAVSTSFARTKVTDTEAIYRDAAGVYTLTQKQNQTKARFRREVRLTKEAIITDPITGVKSVQSVSVGLFIDEPKYGFTDAEIDILKDAITAICDDVRMNRIMIGEY